MSLPQRERVGEGRADGRIGVPDGYEVDEDTAGLRKIFDWIEKDKGKTVIASTIQTVGGKSWE